MEVNIKMIKKKLKQEKTINALRSSIKKIRQHKLV